LTDEDGTDRILWTLRARALTYVIRGE